MLRMRISTFFSTARKNLTLLAVPVRISTKKKLLQQLCSLTFENVSTYDNLTMCHSDSTIAFLCSGECSLDCSAWVNMLCSHMGELFIFQSAEFILAKSVLCLLVRSRSAVPLVGFIEYQMRLACFISGFL